MIFYAPWKGGSLSASYVLVPNVLQFFECSICFKSLSKSKDAAILNNSPSNIILPNVPFYTVECLKNWELKCIMSLAFISLLSQQHFRNLALPFATGCTMTFVLAII